MTVAKKVRREMPFPQVERVIFGTNPLEEVICQLKFPPILKIDTETPAAFQDRIRANYPFYRNLQGMGLSPVPHNLVNLGGGPFPMMPGGVSHLFSSKDEQWTLALTREFLGLTCKRYKQWEEFRDHLSQSFAALRDLYSPHFFVRVGLRYRNLIRRSRLGLVGLDWSELLKPWIAGAYSSPHVRGDVENNSIQMLIRLKNDLGRVLVSSGAFKERGTDEECYLIDADFFTERHTEPSDVLEHLDSLNVQSDRFFHWCIGDTLRDALLAGTSGVP
jgi:uncharacterized protein (TIGR04255 family)